ncbi:MAG: hypothetical protein M3072_14505, partial [Candidatus Dormibacteraeota bacterium]|nr:hypothetical protein [Candidatus Dormibacteraeota bacterium]
MRRRLPAGSLAAAGLVAMILLVIGSSTVLANWVPGSIVLPKVALLAGLLMAILAVIPRVPWAAAVGLGLVLAPIAAYIAASGTIAQSHPGDPTDPQGLAAVWYQRLLTGEAASDMGFYLFLLGIVAWVAGGWLAWCTLRWRLPLLGLLPGALLFATNVLNFPAGQNAYVLFFLVFTLGLLLWITYQRSLLTAARRRAKLSGDARWDFWESGVVVTLVVVVLGIFLPPLSSVDRTVDIASGGFEGWAELQQRLNHPVAFGTGAATG